MTSIRTHFQRPPVFRQVDDYLLAIFYWAGGDTLCHLIHRRNPTLVFSAKNFDYDDMLCDASTTLTMTDDHALVLTRLRMTINARFHRATAHEATLILQDCAQCGVNL